MTDQFDYDNMSHAEFEERLPDFFAAGNVSTDPRLRTFLATHPDCAALVRDLETIAEHARSLFEPKEPSPAVWANIQKSLQNDPVAGEAGNPSSYKDAVQTGSGALSLNGEPDQVVTGGSLRDLD